VGVRITPTHSLHDGRRSTGGRTLTPETARLIESLGVRSLPSELGISFDVFGDVLSALPAYCAEEAFPPSIAHTLSSRVRKVIIGRMREWDQDWGAASQ